MIVRLILLGALLCLGACSSESAPPEGQFSCGIHGGTCRVADQICLTNESCSSCVALPAACTAGAPPCACPFDTDGKATWQDHPCQQSDVKSCEKDGTGGVTIACPTSGWGCG
ncbi:MAG: hypothetical protein KC502_12560 [Myxococcales bacterium]|nr:hypothetical protein [Myxococcales bacterium]